MKNSLSNKGKPKEEARSEEMEIVKRIREKQRIRKRSRIFWWLWSPSGLVLVTSVVALLLLSGSFLTRLFWIGIVLFTLPPLIIGIRLSNIYGVLFGHPVIFFTRPMDGRNRALWGSIKEEIIRTNLGLYLWMIIGFLLIILSYLVIGL